ncbi:hypothetical protein SASPL_102306 [Salvia splendens]|uniref:RRM domain-containing protein n=1 Tax=Salvia splendens TaxID=180675 RepID=A0A8X8YRM6_SALSN|nr:hypothetical protein SASPL_102306 [Salvia splendens]
MPRYEDRYGSTTRLYVGHLSSRTRSRDLEHVFSRYGRTYTSGLFSLYHRATSEEKSVLGSFEFDFNDSIEGSEPLPDLFVLRTKFHALQFVSSFDGLTVSGNHFRRVRDVDMKRDYAFVEFSDPRDADDARYNLDGRDVDGRRITVEFAKGVSYVVEYCVASITCLTWPSWFHVGLEGFGSMWAEVLLQVLADVSIVALMVIGLVIAKLETGRISVTAVEKEVTLRGTAKTVLRSSVDTFPVLSCPRLFSGRGRSYSRSPVRSRSPRRGGRSRSRSFSRSRSYSRSRSPAARRGRDADYKERRSRSPIDESPDLKRAATPTKSRKLSPPPDRDVPREQSASPSKGRVETEQDGYNSDSPKETSRSPVSPAARRYEESPYEENGRNRSPSPREDRSPVEDDDPVRSPRGSASP